MDDDLGDWRIAAVTRLAADLSEAYPGGPSHKAGAPVYQTTHIEKDGGYLGFVVPSAPAMALNVAIESCVQANELLKAIEYKDVATPDGTGKSVSDEHIEGLYNFFEKCMISTTFSYQALEAFCNHSIITKLKVPLVVKRKNKKVQMTPQEIERNLSTSEKLSSILPKLFNVPTPKGKKPWEPYKKLQSARDSTIHLKTFDQYATYNESLFVRFLDGEFKEYPSATAGILRHFIREGQPRWLIALDKEGI